MTQKALSSKNTKKVAFFGGTFDPIHFGHINLAIQIKEKELLDEVIFCPAALSPHKVDKEPIASSNERLDMVRCAIKGIKGFSCSDIEIKKGGISYTIDTIAQLSREMQNLYLIFSEETLPNLHLWKDIEKLLTLASPLVGCSSQFKIENNSPVARLIKSQNLITISWLQITSTYIRERLKKEQFCGHLLPQEVLDYIYHHNLYCVSC